MVSELTEIVNEVRAESIAWRKLKDAEISVIAADVKRYKEIEEQLKGAGKLGKIIISIGIAAFAICSSAMAFYNSYMK